MSSGGRIKELIKKYGKVAVGVHLTVYAASLAGCYVAIESKVDVKGLLAKYNLLSEKDLVADNNEQDRSWLAKVLSSPGSTFALAFICNKALLPVRAPVTLALTPMVARVLQRSGRLKAPQ